MSSPSRATTRDLVRDACLAPSVHNTQPWSWRLSSPSVVELLADRSRQLTRTDPDGRGLLVSCGAALHHLLVAADGHGLTAATTLLPDDAHPDVLARVRLTPGESRPDAVEKLAALRRRRTDRRPFTSWEVPTPRLADLAARSSDRGAQVRVLSDPGERHVTEVLLDRARRDQLAHHAVTAEQEAWVAHGLLDGVPLRHAVPPAEDGRQAGRFGGPELGESAAPEQEHADGLLLVLTSTDDRESHLRAGLALSDVWVRATQAGLAVVPQTQVTEDPGTRRELRDRVLDGLGWPQVLVRVGWLSTSRRPWPATPRRPLDDVLVP